MLLTDSDGVFASGAVVHTGIYIAGTNTWDFSLNIADMDYIAFAKTVFSDTTSPTILTASVSSGTLAPIGTFPLTYTYSDTGSAINAASFTGKIYPWDSTGATWSVIDIASSYLSVTSASTSTGILQLTNLPFGKYRFDILISDTAGNTLTQSYTYFVDAVIWTVSAPLYPIGAAPLGSNTFGS